MDFIIRPFEMEIQTKLDDFVKIREKSGYEGMYLDLKYFPVDQVDLIFDGRER